MAINFKKSCCLRVGPRCDAHCVSLQSMTGSMSQWVDTVRYLGMYLVKAKYFKCSLDYAKRSFHWAANSVFGKIGRIASEESVLQLIKGKCLPILLYGLETCSLKKADLRSLDFVIDRLFMKLFKTNKIDVVREFQQYFNFELPSVSIANRAAKFQSLFHVHNSATIVQH